MEKRSWNHTPVSGKEGGQPSQSALCSAARKRVGRRGLVRLRCFSPEQQVPPLLQLVARRGRRRATFCPSYRQLGNSTKSRERRAGDRLERGGKRAEALPWPGGPSSSSTPNSSGNSPNPRPSPRSLPLPGNKGIQRCSSLLLSRCPRAAAGLPQELASPPDSLLVARPPPQRVAASSDGETASPLPASLPPPPSILRRRHEHVPDPVSPPSGVPTLPRSPPNQPQAFFLLRLLFLPGARSSASIAHAHKHKGGGGSSSHMRLGVGPCPDRREAAAAATYLWPPPDLCTFSSRRGSPRAPPAKVNPSGGCVNGAGMGG